jgi:hypothetical protein
MMIGGSGSGLGYLFIGFRSGGLGLLMGRLPPLGGRSLYIFLYERRSLLGGGGGFGLFLDLESVLGLEEEEFEADELLTLVLLVSLTCCLLVFFFPDFLAGKPGSAKPARPSAMTTRSPIK